VDIVDLPRNNPY